MAPLTAFTQKLDKPEFVVSRSKQEQPKLACANVVKTEHTREQAYLGKGEAKRRL
jgi:hypothetical protein